MNGMKKLGSMLLAMLLALSLCGFALAEGEADTVDTAAAADALKEAEEKSQALTDALAAYSAAKKESRMKAKLESLKQELDAYVAAGSLTQEQADLLLSYYAEQMVQNAAGGTSRGSRNGKSGQKIPQNGQKNGFGRGGRHGRMNSQTSAAPQSSDTAAAQEGTGI